MIVHSYARFSDPSQEAGDSLRRQRQAAEDFCKRRGWQLSNLTFTDKGKSGFRGDKQKALAAFVDAVDEGLVKPGEVLLVEAVDRLSRKGVRATQTLVNKILDAGIDIAILVPVEKIYRAGDRNDIGGAIELAAFAFQASVYSENLSSRVKAYNQQAKRELRAGKRNRISAVVPSWLTWNASKERFDTKPEAVKAIKFIFEQTISGQGRKQMLRDLNEKFPPLGTRKNCHGWNETYIGKIVKNRAVLGEMNSTVTGETFKDYYPAIIDEKTWKRANVEASKRRTERGPQQVSVNLFNGILFHAADNCAMGLYRYQATRADGRVIRYARYKSYRNTHGENGTSTETVDLERFENLVFQFLPTLELGKKRHNEFEQLQDERGYLQGEIESIQGQLRTRSGSAAVLGPVLSDLADQLADVEKRLAGTERKSVEPTQAYREKLSRMKRGTIEERREVRDAIRRIIKRIEVLPVKLGPVRRDPVKCLVEIQFRNGEFVRAVELEDNRLVKVSGPKVERSLSEQIKDGWRFTSVEYRKLITKVVAVAV